MTLVNNRLQLPPDEYRRLLAILFAPDPRPVGVVSPARVADPEGAVDPSGIAPSGVRPAVERQA